MDRRRLLAGIVGVVFVLGGVAAAEPAGADDPLEIVLDLGEEGDRDTVQPNVDCSDGRPDDDCLSGRVGSDQATQTCAGIAVMFGAGSCSVHCREGSYACGKCGWGGVAMCTCRENFSCNPYGP